QRWSWSCRSWSSLLVSLCVVRVGVGRGLRRVTARFVDVVVDVLVHREAVLADVLRAALVRIVEELDAMLRAELAIPDGLGAFLRLVGKGARREIPARDHAEWVGDPGQRHQVSGQRHAPRDLRAEVLAV